MKRLPHYSQHFLRSPRLAKDLIGHTSIKRSDLVYDIGAGSGVIASALAGRCGRVIAVEIEPQTVKTLRKNMEKYPNVHVETADFLSLELPNTPYKVFSNIPFHLSSAIVRKLTEASNPPDSSYLIVQKQFARKLLPDHKGFSNQLGMLIGPEFAVRIRKPLKKTDFWPHPNVDTVLLEIKRREEPLLPANQLTSYRRFIAKHFLSPESFAKLPLGLVRDSPTTKPSSLTLSNWLVLFQQTKR